MRLKVEDYLTKTDSRHSDIIDAYAYMVAASYAKLADDYILLHIKKRPYWIPDCVYRWLLSKILVISRFKN